MRTMYEITSSLQELLYLMESEEIPEEMISDTLEAVGLEVELVADNVANMLAELSADCDKLKAEERRLHERRQMMEGNASRLKAQLLHMLQTADKKSFKTTLHSFSVRGTAGKTVVTAPDMLPDEYFRIPEPTPPELDIKKITAAIKSGDIPEDVAHIEKGVCIVIK